MHSFVFIILFCPEAARVKLKNCSRDFILPLFFFFFLPSKQFRDRDAETAPAHKTRWNISTQTTQFPNVTNLKRQHFTVGFVNYSSLETENNAEQRAFCAKSVSRPEVKLHRKKGAFANAGMKICYTSRQATKQCAPAKVLTALFRTEIETMYGNRYQLFSHSCCKCALLQTCTEAMRKSLNSTPNAAGCWKRKRIKSWE